MSDYEHHLLPYLDPGKIQTLSCGHVIPPCNLLAAPIIKASDGVEFDFTFEGRNKESTVSLFHVQHSIHTDGVQRPSISGKLSLAWLETSLMVWSFSSRVMHTWIHALHHGSVCLLSLRNSRSGIGSRKQSLSSWSSEVISNPQAHPAHQRRPPWTPS